MRICCDIDGVLNNLMEVAIDIFNQKYNKTYTVNDITAYNLEDCFEPEEANQMKQIFEDPTIWHKVKPVEGAQNGLRKLIQGGYQVYLVTNNSPYTYGAKFDWIRRYYPFVESSKIICMKDKWYFNCDLMLEDCLETLIAKPYYDRVLMDKPWNQSTKDYVYGIHRCSSWDEIVDVVNKLNEE